MYFVTFYKKAYKAKAIQYAYIKSIYYIYMYIYIIYIYIHVFPQSSDIIKFYTEHFLKHITLK